jgi:hypothetical protein
MAAPTWGMVHTQYTTGNTAQARAAFTTQPIAQEQFIMGWGTLNPEPSPGSYNWQSMDSRARLIRDLGGQFVIGLCAAPDWMKGGAAGQTDWTKIAVAPVPEHYGDFATLSAAVAQRYPDARYFLVWNEMKGMFNRDLHRWNYEGYTDLYNQVWDAIKAVRPDAQVGGPYVVADIYPVGRGPAPSNVSGRWGMADQRSLDVITYWLAHKRGADFVCLDGTSTNKATKTMIGGPYVATASYYDIVSWVRAQTDLPVLWAEARVEPPNSGWTEAQRTAVLSHALLCLARAGAVGLHWARAPGQPGGLLAGSTGTATQLLQVIQFLARHFPPGTIPTFTASGSVQAIQSPTGIMAVDTATDTVTLTAQSGTSTRPGAG